MKRMILIQSWIALIAAPVWAQSLPKENPIVEAAKNRTDIIVSAARQQNDAIVKAAKQHVDSLVKASEEREQRLLELSQRHVNALVNASNRRLKSLIEASHRHRDQVRKDMIEEAKKILSLNPSSLEIMIPRPLSAKTNPAWAQKMVPLLHLYKLDTKEAFMKIVGATLPRDRDSKSKTTRTEDLAGAIRFYNQYLGEPGSPLSLEDALKFSGFKLADVDKDRVTKVTRDSANALASKRKNSDQHEHRAVVNSKRASG